MSERACVCGHPKRQHVQPFGDYTAAGAGLPWHCAGPEIPNDFGGCSCEGYQVPVVKGKRPEFGRDRLPRRLAEAAPAWPPLGDKP